MARVPGSRLRPTALVAPLASFVAVGAIVTLALIAPGYDAQEAPRLEASVWVTRDLGQYARVNTELGEIDTTRSVAEPAGLVQSGSRGLVFTQGFVQEWPLDGAHPTDLAADAQGGSGSAASQVMATPTGTTYVAAAGPYVLYLTGSGQVYLGTLPDGKTKTAAARKLDPFAEDVAKEGDEPRTYVAQAAAIDDDGEVVMYSSFDGGVRRFHADTGRFDRDVTAVPQAPDAGDDLQMTIAGGRWALFSPANGTMWIAGHDASVSLDVGADALLQTGTSSDDVVLVADEAGLVTLDVSAGTPKPTRVVQAQGTPAAPVYVDGVSYAAWVSRTGASLWSSKTDQAQPLDIDAQALADVPSLGPVFRSNGDRAVLSETTTGLLWTVPDGRLIPLSDWDDPDEGEQQQGTVKVDDLIEQEPPVATPDSFGVRRGAVVTLPLLLNDYDPNKKDVLTIDPGVLTPIADAGFGSLSLVNHQQQAVVNVSASEGTSTFTYSASDGFSTSSPATVSLTVVPDDVNTAPQWCPVDHCVQDWPTPQVAPGGYASIPVMDGWVDAEGDAILLLDAKPTTPGAPVSVIPTADGHVVVRHLDPNAGEATIPLTVTVSDALGAQTTKSLDLRVTSTPALDVEAVAVSGAVSTPVSVSIADHVSGGSGSYRLVEATASQGREDAFVVSPSAATGTIELSATEPGNYSATYTVEDTTTLAQLTAVIRLTVPSSTDALAVPPLTAFVRTGEDTTVDVLASANATSGRVLIVSGATTSAENLKVGVVGNSLVRVSATSTAVLPGPLGVAEVSFTDGAGNSATTQLTVFLLPASHGVGPVASPDAVSVRAGTQIDIPALANDVSPRGERIILHPDVQGSDADGELAFASGTNLRYLAPKTPGVYVVRYSIYLENDPTMTDTATVTITVLPEGSNRAPQPRALEARALAGHSVIIPLTLSGIDPDGDPVVLADVTQPDKGQGTVSIGPAGETLVYRAPEVGVPGGQARFTYTVTDPDGEPAVATVSVGVLDAEVTDVTPVTYADYVSARLGAVTPVTVHPLVNDRDPMQGKLVITNLVPNAAPSSDEYSRLESLIDPTTSLKDGVVVLRAGDVEGSHSYRYTVQSSVSTSNADGLIVIGTSDSPAPETLVVSDTTVTAQTRGLLATGIDVVTGKVQWPTGDVSTLKLALWGDAAQGFSQSGSSIKGTLPEERTVVPFSLTGTDANGQPITTYAFLRIPAFDEMRLQLKPQLAPFDVPEEGSVKIDLRDALDINAGDRLEIRGDDAFAVQRGNARCVASDADTVSYAAGREAPWRDTCSVAVRLVGQETWSIVPIPISIQPKDPQAILSPVSRTVTPGAQDSVDILGNLVSWEGGRKGSTQGLSFSIDYKGSAFVVNQNGSVVNFQALAGAKTGTRETIRVSTSAYGGLTTTINLEVGAALNQSPKGATFTTKCDVSKGPSCSLTAIGLPSEFDPYAGTPGGGLHLKSVGTGDSVECSVATVTKASDTQLMASWPSGPRPVGGECVAQFTVADAQDGTGLGQVTIDVLGYPQTPASITTVGYTGTSVTLAVALGQATQAHPAVTGVALYEAGSPVAADCAPAGPSGYECEVNGLVNGAKHTYTARAINSVGESLDTTSVVSWAYQAPVITNVTTAPVYDPTYTTEGTGVLKVSVDGAEDIDHYVIENNGTSIGRTGATSEANATLSVGNQSLNVTPVSKFTPPIAGDNTGSTFMTSVVVPGAPIYSGAASAPETGTDITISSPALQANYSAEPLHELWFVWTVGTPTCSMTGSGDVEVTGADVPPQSSPTFTGLAANTTYHVSVCGTNGYGATMATHGDVFTWVPIAPPAPISYEVDPDASGSQTNKLYALNGQPSVASQPGWSLVYWYDGAMDNGTLKLRPDVVQTITATYCLTAHPERCTYPTYPRTAVSPVAGTALTSVTASVSNTCTDDPLEDDVQISAPAYPDRQISIDSTWPTNTYTLTWGGDYSSLHSTTLKRPMCTNPHGPPGGP